GTRSAWAAANVCGGGAVRASTSANVPTASARPATPTAAAVPRSTVSGATSSTGSTANRTRPMRATRTRRGVRGEPATAEGREKWRAKGGGAGGRDEQGGELPASIPPGNRRIGDRQRTKREGHGR